MTKGIVKKIKVKIVFRFFIKIMQDYFILPIRIGLHVKL